MRPGPPRRYATASPPNLNPRQPEEPEATSSPLDIASALRPLVAQNDAAEKDKLDRIEAAMRRLPPLPPALAPDAPPSIAAAKPLAMTPLEGPDIGETNPNDTRDYYARLRRPEGTIGNDNAVNPISGAGGPFQFLPSTWRDIMKSNPELGLTMEGFRDAKNNMPMHMAAIKAYTDRSRKALEFLGRAPTMGELYAAHLFGQQGGANFLKSLDKSVGEVIPGSWIDANPWIRSLGYAGKPGRELLKYFEKMMGAK